MGYHHKLQSLIYHMLKNEGLTDIHDKAGYKFFCFSSIFPSNNMHKNDSKNLIISSPNEKLINALEKYAQKIKNSQTTIEVGKMRFRLDRYKVFSIAVPEYGIKVITGTPILMRISRERYLRYNIDPKIPYRYIFWRKEYPTQMFVEQLEENLKKKYQQFTGDSIPQITILQKIKFRKQISNKIPIKGKIQTIIGTLWEFNFQPAQNQQLLQFSIDAGFGERNSLGFGFMNVIDNFKK